jgi:hypothetical protein
VNKFAIKEDIKCNIQLINIWSFSINVMPFVKSQQSSGGGFAVDGVTSGVELVTVPGVVTVPFTGVVLDPGTGVGAVPVTGVVLDPASSVVPVPVSGVVPVPV